MVMDILGHSQIQVTLGTYSHVLPELHRGAAARMDVLLLGTRKVDERFAICETLVRIISRRRLREFWERHPQSETVLVAWYQITKRRRWNSIADVRKDFPHADAVGPLTVFNIGGNDFRMVVDIVYRAQVVYVKAVMTHAEYDKRRWK